MQFKKKMFANAPEIAKIANIFFRERFPIYGNSLSLKPLDDCEQNW